MTKNHLTYIFIWLTIFIAIFFITKFISPEYLSIKVTMPPAKTERQVELEIKMKKQGLISSESDEYDAITEQRNKAWDNQPMVSQILKGIDSGKEAKLRNELVARNLTEKEIEQFMAVLYSEAPYLIKE